MSNASPDYENQLRTLLDYLAAAAVIVRENGSIRLLRRGGATPVPADEERSAMATPDVKEQTTSVPKPSVVSFFQQAAQGAVQFSVDVKVDMTEFAEWSPERISSFFAGIAQVLAAKGAIEKKSAE